MQALEGAEQVFPVAHVETGAVVADHEGIDAFMAGGFEADLRMFDAAGEFPGVAEQIFQHGAHQARVALDFEMRRDLHPHVPFRFLLAQFLADGLGEHREVYRATIQFFAADPRQGQQVVDELSHAMHGCADAA